MSETIAAAAQRVNYELVLDYDGQEVTEPFETLKAAMVMWGLYRSDAKCFSADLYCRSDGALHNVRLEHFER